MSSSPSLPQQPRSLIAIPLAVNSSEFRRIQGWAYPDEPFYLRQVRQMLLRDIPQIALFENCAIWGYIDPAAASDFVGFGTIRVSDLYSRYTGGQPHCYIPLLAVNSRVQSYGYGKSIVEHLVAEAAIVHAALCPVGSISDLVFLDVYKANEKAYRLYHEKCQFVPLNPDAPILDPDENNEPYIIMARNISIFKT